MRSGELKLPPNRQNTWEFTAGKRKDEAPDPQDKDTSPDRKMKAEAISQCIKTEVLTQEEVAPQPPPPLKYKINKELAITIELNDE